MFSFIKNILNPCDHSYNIVGKIPYISTYNDSEYVYHCILLECKNCGKRKVEYTTFVPPLNIKIFMDKWIYKEYDTDLILKMCTNEGKQNED